MSADNPLWKVAFTKRAEQDIEEIFSFLMEREGPDIAEAFLNKFMEAREKLCAFPERGRIPPELSRVHILSYREILVPPYRVIFQAASARREVYIHVVADSRRNFVELLKKRLFQASFRKNLVQ